MGRDSLENDNPKILRILGLVRYCIGCRFSRLPDIEYKNQIPGQMICNKKEKDGANERAREIDAYNFCDDWEPPRYWNGRPKKEKK
jgi:hypothetical protein